MKSPVAVRESDGSESIFRLPVSTSRTKLEGLARSTTISTTTPGRPGNKLGRVPLDTWACKPVKPSTSRWQTNGRYLREASTPNFHQGLFESKPPGSDQGRPGKQQHQNAESEQCVADHHGPPDCADPSKSQIIYRRQQTESPGTGPGPSARETCTNEVLISPLRKPLECGN